MQQGRFFGKVVCAILTRPFKTDTQETPSFGSTNKWTGVELECMGVLLIKFWANT